MRWCKLGQVFAPDGGVEWMTSHAACPATEQLDEHRFRIYFSPRDSCNRSAIACLEIDIRDPQKILRLSARPVLQFGRRGAFDDNGVSVGCLVPLPGELRLYYMGWNVNSGTIWRNSIGMCYRAGPTGEFRRWSEMPVLGRNPYDPQSLTYPWVHRDETGWRMWYGSHVALADRREDIRHVLKMAHSMDGISWTANSRIVIDLVGSDFAVTKPCVIRDSDRWRMWFSRCHGSEYRMGYAESADGESWRCHDAEVGIQPSADGWDSRSVEYGYIFDCGSDRYMLYNGRDYGRTGFGLAILEQD